MAVEQSFSRDTRARWCIIILAFLVAVASASGSQAAKTDVLRATLSNGLQVIIVRNTLAPVVTTSINYKVGSDEAPAGFPGMAHAQEHMMFRGSPGLSAEQLADIGSVMGGDFNADTSESRTQYLFTVPATDLEIALHIEALRMTDVVDSAEGWDQERGAIEQEVAQDASNPEHTVADRLRAAFFAGTPYEHDALGTRSSFDKTTSTMLKAFHSTWYAPNNAILVIVGDVDPKSALEKVKVLFGAIAPKNLPVRPAVILKPVDLTPISVGTNRPFATRILAMRLPGIAAPDFPALELLADVLASHRFELYGLVAQGKALGADFSLDALPQASIGSAEISIPPDGDMITAEREIRALLTKVARNGVPPDLVAAAKIQESREAEFQKNSIEDLASGWADAVALYGLRSLDEDLARMEKVTPEEVNRVARKYLDLDHAVTVTMTPQASERQITASDRFGGKESLAMAEATPIPLPDWAENALDQPMVPQSTLHPVVSTLPNGITLIVQPEDVSNTVSVYGHIKNRPETETASGKDGVAAVLNALFAYGSEHVDRQNFQKALDSIGADERAGPDFALETLTQDFDRGVSLLADNELHPVFSPNAMRVTREQLRQAIAARMQTPAFVASRSLRESLFAKGDPALRESTPERIGQLTTDDVRAYYDTAFRPDLTTIVVIGKITPDNARRVIEKYFGSWRAMGPKPKTDLPAGPLNRPATMAVPDDSSVQDTVALAENFPLSRNDPDYYALQLGNAVLGGGFYSSRLSVELRKKTGLVYSVDTDLQSDKTRSVYLISYACDPGNVNHAANIVSSELADMQTTPVSFEELTRAKAFLLRQIPLGEASEEDIAEAFNARSDLDLPLDEPTVAANRYLKLDATDVQAAFDKWLRPGDLVQVSQGPAPR